MTVPDTTPSSQASILDLAPDGSPLQAYLRWSTKVFGAPPIYHLMGCLAVTAHELARRGFHLRGPWPLNLWVAFVGDSATGKSSALRMVRRFMSDLRLATDSGETVDWVQAEGSIAGLLTAVQEHYDQARGTTCCMLYHNELAAVFAQPREPIAEMLCQLADGETYQRNLRELQRKSGKKERDRSDRIISPVVSAIFCTTEQQLAPHFKESHRSGGMFSRIWWLKSPFTRENFRMIDDHAGIEADDPSYFEAQEVWKAWAAYLDVLRLDQGHLLQLRPDAHEELRASLFAPLTAACTEGDDRNPVRMRGIEKARVIAGIFAAMRCSTTIEPRDVKAAVKIVEVLLEHAWQVSTLGADSVFRWAAKAEQIVRATEDKGCPRRELYQSLRLDKRTLDTVLETLIDQERVVEDRKGDDGRVRYFHVHSSHGSKVKSRLRERGRYQA